MHLLFALSLFLTSAGPAAVDDFAGCAAPRHMCPLLEGPCCAAGVDVARCFELAWTVCPGNKCLACERALDDCETSGGTCEALAAYCNDSLEFCGCDEPRCRDMTALDLPQLLAACYAWPLTLGCDAPSTGQCMTTLTFEGCVGLTTCEYFACMEAIKQLDMCSDDPPAACDEVRKCVALEAGR